MTVRGLSGVLRRLIMQRSFMPEPRRTAQPRGLDSLVLAALCVLKGVAQHAQARPLWQAIRGRACATLFESLRGSVWKCCWDSVLPTLCAFDSTAQYAQAWPIVIITVKVKAYRQSSLCRTQQQGFYTGKCFEKDLEHTLLGVRQRRLWCEEPVLRSEYSFNQQGPRHGSCAGEAAVTTHR